LSLPLVPPRLLLLARFQLGTDTAFCRGRIWKGSPGHEAWRVDPLVSSPIVIAELLDVRIMREVVGQVCDMDLVSTTRR
jgi:hypothetical protein